MSSRDTDLSHLHPQYRDRIVRVLERLEAESIPFRLFEGFRSAARQNELFGQRPKVTNARAWQSAHQYGVSADLVLFENGNWSWETKGKRAAWWKRMQEIGREEGLEPLSWELPHLQLKGFNWRTLQSGQYPSGGDASWAENLAAAIRKHPQGAPPVPKVAPMRPALAENAPEPEPDHAPEPTPDPQPEPAPLVVAAVAAVPGSAPTDTVRVTSGSNSWYVTYATIAAGVCAVARENFAALLGLPKEIHILLIVLFAIGGWIFIHYKSKSDTQIRDIASDPSRQTVK